MFVLHLKQTYYVAFAATSNTVCLKHLVSCVNEHNMFVMHELKVSNIFILKTHAVRIKLTAWKYSDSRNFISYLNRVISNILTEPRFCYHYH